MEFFDKLLSSIGGGGPRPPCPKCGGALDPEGLKEGSYWCESCGTLFVDQINELVDLKSLRPSGRTCVWCEESLDAGVHYLPYEDGSTPHAYIICPSCNQENIQYGFGEDD
jgi:hypothetical protein